MAGGSVEDASLSRSSQDDEDDLDRRIAEAEFMLAREQALQAARNTYRSVLSHLAQPAATSNSDSISALVPDNACNADQFSAAPEDNGARAAAEVPVASTRIPNFEPAKTHKPRSQSRLRRCSWRSCWYPLLLCLSILTIPAEWAALRQSDMEAPRSVHRLWFLIASQVVLSFLGASQSSRLAPTHVTVHVALQVSVLGSWVLSALSYVRSVSHNAEQELALVLSFMRVLLSLNVGKRTPLFTLLAFGATAARCMSLAPHATLKLEPCHVLLACSAASFCRWMLHHLCTFGQLAPHEPACGACTVKWPQEAPQQPGAEPHGRKPCYA